MSRRPRSACQGMRSLAGHGLLMRVRSGGDRVGGLDEDGPGGRVGLSGRRRRAAGEGDGGSRVERGAAGCVPAVGVPGVAAVVGEESVGGAGCPVGDGAVAAAGAAARRRRSWPGGQQLVGASQKRRVMLAGGVVEEVGEGGGVGGGSGEPGRGGDGGLACRTGVAEVGVGTGTRIPRAVRRVARGVKSLSPASSAIRSGLVSQAICQQVRASSTSAPTSPLPVSGTSWTVMPWPASAVREGGGPGAADDVVRLGDGHVLDRAAVQAGGVPPDRVVQSRRADPGPAGMAEELLGMPVPGAVIADRDPHGRRAGAGGRETGARRRESAVSGSRQRRRFLLGGACGLC